METKEYPQFSIGTWKDRFVNWTEDYFLAVGEDWVNVQTDRAHGRHKGNWHYMVTFNIKDVDLLFFIHINPGKTSTVQPMARGSAKNFWRTDSYVEMITKGAQEEFPIPA